MTYETKSPQGQSLPQGHAFSRWAGLIVSCASAVFVLGLVWNLFAITDGTFSQYSSMSAGVQSHCVDTADGCGALLLEAKIQQMRSGRVASALLMRHVISSATIVAGLTMIVLGSVLCFDRTIGPQNTTAGVNNGENFGAAIRTPWPGALLFTLGAVVLSLNIYFAGPGAARIRFSDLPVFIEDVNWARNFKANRRAMIDINAPVAATAGAITQQPAADDHISNLIKELQGDTK